MATSKQIFDKRNSVKLTENGDIAFNKASVSDELVNTLFMSEYYQNHLDEVTIGNTDRDKWFSRFMRDPRLGIGKRDLGRKLMRLSGCSFDEMVMSGRFDDIFSGVNITKKIADFMYEQIQNGNELAKKWMPRYSSKNLMVARQFAKYWGMNKQQYGKFIKCNTTENKLSRKTVDDIKFDQVPSLALIKYYNRFKEGEDTKYRFMEYLSKVKKGEVKMNISTTTVYDIYKNREKIDADLFFEKMEKIKGSWIPIVDTSGSMWDNNDSIGKALSIGHYLAKCSTYAPSQIISFSSYPQLLELGKDYGKNINDYGYYGWGYNESKVNLATQYGREINSMFTGDCSNTDFGAVMELLKDLTELPEYLIVLSDMEFDQGSSMRKSELEALWKENGYTTKIIWWNLNSRSTTAPEMDDMGNIFLSGYNPTLLKYLECGFNATQFIDKLLDEYKVALCSKSV